MISKMAAQGDCLFLRVEALPADATAAPLRGDRATVAHSETGHDHVAHGPGLAYYTSADPLVCYLRCEAPLEVTHLRPFDTHAPLTLAAGTWQVRRQREYTPQGLRRVED
jgi:hypothetical protein